MPVTPQSFQVVRTFAAQDHLAIQLQNGSVSTFRTDEPYQRWDVRDGVEVLLSYDWDTNTWSIADPPPEG